jgi:hypothetical protein
MTEENDLVSIEQMTRTPGRRLGASDLRVSPIGLGCWQLSGSRGW